ncbi:MAG: hypothetical protein J6T01_03185 [Kiritimatiellae bacterium]|nr:hypothetical protein [Kiritimatiellia bacterium]
MNDSGNACVNRRKLRSGAVALLAAGLALSAQASLDAAKCRIPERFREHPIFTTRHCGVNFGFLSRRGYFARPETMAQPEKIRAAGANWVTLNTHFCQETFASRRTFLDFDWSAGEIELTEIVKELHRRGLHILLKPCLTNLDSSWMGAVRFPSKADQQIQGVTNTYWQTWFGSLRDCLKYYAEFAEKNGVEAMIIGAEYNGTTGQDDEWLATIRHVRRYYSGPLTYEFMSSEIREGGLTWLKELDFLSLSFYPSAAGRDWKERYDRANWPKLAPVPLESMKKMLAERRRDVAEISKRFDNMPVLFTEIGTRSSRGNVMLPWDALTESVWDGEEQANYMEAVFQTFSDLPCWMGLSWWKWDETQKNRTHYSPDPLKDRGFTVYGKPAAAVLRKWCGVK